MQRQIIDSEQILNNSSPASSKRFITESRTLLVLALPIIVSQLAQMGVNLTDTLMAGRHSDVSLAGVAIGSSLWVPGFLLLSGILMAVTPMIAQAWGGGRTHDIRHTTQQGMWLALLLGISMLLLLQSLSGLFAYMPMEAAAREQAIGYLDAVTWGLPAIALFQVLRGLNEGAQLTRPFMYVSLIALLINIPLNYIFVYGKFGLPEMGGVGCGWATTITLWFELFMMLALTQTSNVLKKISWHKNFSPPQWRQIYEIIQLGLPIGIALLIEASMFSLIALFLAELGATVVAGHQVAISVTSTLFMIPLSLSFALTIRCGYCLGQGQPERARYIGFLGMGFTLFIALLYSITIILSNEWIASLYSNNEEVIQLAAQLLLLAIIFQLSDAIQVSAAGALRGYKDTRFAFGVVLFSYWITGLPLGYSLGLTGFWGEPMGAHGFWYGLIAGLGLASILLAFRFALVSRRQIQKSHFI